MRYIPLSGKKIYRAILLLYGGVIFYISTRPTPAEAVPVPLPHFDKLVHGVEFLIFALLCFVSWPKSSRSQVRLSAVVVLSSAYGGFIELYQSRLPTRSACVIDWMADFVGIFLAALIWLSWRRKERRWSRPEKGK